MFADAKRLFVQLPLEELPAKTAAAEAALAKDPTDKTAFNAVSRYMHLRSVCVLPGDGSLKNAKALGYLDARDLYPGIPVTTLEEFASWFYKLLEPGYMYQHWMDKDVPKIQTEQ